jgi:hypothetical protein
MLYRVHDSMERIRYHCNAANGLQHVTLRHVTLRHVTLRHLCDDLFDATTHLRGDLDMKSNVYGLSRFLLWCFCATLVLGCGGAGPITEIDPSKLSVEPSGTVKERLQIPGGADLPCTIRFPDNYDPQTKVPLIVV